jgi:hypothetical protein
VRCIAAAGQAVGAHPKKGGNLSELLINASGVVGWCNYSSRPPLLVLSETWGFSLRISDSGTRRPSRPTIFRTFSSYSTLNIGPRKFDMIYP